MPASRSMSHEQGVSINETCCWKQFNFKCFSLHMPNAVLTCDYLWIGPAPTRILKLETVPRIILWILLIWRWWQRQKKNCTTFWNSTLDFEQNFACIFFVIFWPSQESLLMVPKRKYEAFTHLWRQHVHKGGIYIEGAIKWISYQE